MENSGLAKFQAPRDGDRISDLPDDLLRHVLSFLPTKYAMATSILSTRWKYLFASLPILDLDYQLVLPTPRFRNHFHNIMSPTVSSFTNFVHRMLLPRKPPYIRSFRLSCSDDDYIGFDIERHVNAWISAALWSGVMEIDLSANCRSWIFHNILRSRTLVVLKLCHWPDFGDCDFPVCLPSLKVMHLRSVVFGRSIGSRRLFSGCPMLEELKLFDFGATGVLDIPIPSLKILTLDCDYYLTCRIRFDTPILEFFEYSNSCVADGRGRNQGFITDTWLFPHMLRSSTLVVLKLCHWSDYRDRGIPVWLPSLKVMHLQSVEFGRSGTWRFFCSCPMLEELKLFNIRIHESGVLDIYIPSLKSLTLYCDDDLNFGISLHTPILEFFEYSDSRVADAYLGKELKSVVNACLDVGLSNEQFEEVVSSHKVDVHMVNCHAVANLVNEICGVKSLHLSGVTLEAIDRFNQCLPTFHNLIHLELGINLEDGWPLLPKFLESLPKLEVLVFVKGFRYYTGIESRYLNPLPENVPMCLSLCLKEIEFQEFYGEEDELKLIEYFLKSGEVLKKITINLKSFSEWPSNICDRLLMFPKSSTTCQIVLAGQGK